MRPLRLVPWRVVESQHQLSTRKLVSNAEEQIVLEELIERAKPGGRSTGRRHYLLTTPFRYPPLRYGSRFGTRNEAGIWYGSETRQTAFAEVAYYRFVFLQGTQAELGVLTTPLTAFRVLSHSPFGVDLVIPPFQAHAGEIASPESYTASQALGHEMRGAGVLLFRYPSARDPHGGVNVGAFAPEVFGRAKPRDLENWHCSATRQLVEMAKRDYFGRHVHSFTREMFLVQGKLPAPAP